MPSGVGLVGRKTLLDPLPVLDRVVGVRHEDAADRPVGPRGAGERRGELFVGELAISASVSARAASRSAKRVSRSSSLCSRTLSSLPLCTRAMISSRLAAAEVEPDRVLLTGQVPSDHPLERALDHREMRDVVLGGPRRTVLGFALRALADEVVRRTASGSAPRDAPRSLASLPMIASRSGIVPPQVGRDQR